MLLSDLTVDVRDAVGDRLHISDEFKKDGVRLERVRSVGAEEADLPPRLQTTFEIGQAQRIQNLHNQKEISASKMISDSKGRRGERISPPPALQLTSRHLAVFPRTAHVVEDGPACRVRLGGIGREDSS